MTIYITNELTTQPAAEILRLLHETAETKTTISLRFYITLYLVTEIH